MAEKKQEESKKQPNLDFIQTPLCTFCDRDGKCGSCIAF